MNSFRGLNGTLQIVDNSVVIEREGGIDKTFHKIDRMVIPIEKIQDVVVVLGSLVNGHITILEKGSEKPNGIWKAIHDDNTVVFRLFHNFAAEKFAREVKSLLEGQ